MKSFVLPAMLFAVSLCLVPSATADDYAYAGSSSGEFGTIDLSTEASLRRATPVRHSPAWRWLTETSSPARITPLTELYLK